MKKGDVAGETASPSCVGLRVGDPVRSDWKSRRSPGLCVRAVQETVASAFDGVNTEAEKKLRIRDWFVPAEGSRATRKQPDYKQTAKDHQTTGRAARTGAGFDTMRA